MPDDRIDSQISEMSEAPRYLYRGCDGSRMLFEIVEPCTALGFTDALGLSKPVVRRVFDDRQLSAITGVDEAAGSEPRPDDLDGVAAPTKLNPAPSQVLARQTRLDVGTVVCLDLCVRREPGPSSSAPVSIVYEDDFVLAANKPQGLLVHGDGTGADTLSARVQGYLRHKGSDAVPQALQRLDVETSGVVLLSKTEEFQPVFDALVAGDAMRKTYLAVVRGAFDRETRTLRDPIGRDRHDARKMRVSPGTGMPALTFVRRLATSGNGGASLLSVTLGTGRRHQIRVHLAACGYPVMGDELYGTSHGGGLMLHAYKEEFDHPITGEHVSICAGWPQRFDAWFSERDASGQFAE